MRPSSVRAPFAAGSVDDERDLAVVHDSRAGSGRPSASFLTRVTWMPPASSRAAGAFGGDDLVAQRDQPAGQIDDGLFVPLADAEKNLAFGRQHGAGGELALGEGDAEPLADAHHFAGAPHLRAEHDIDAGELAEREDAFLDADVRGNRLARQAQFRQLHARSSPSRRFSPPARPWPWRRTAPCGWRADSLPARRRPACRLRFLTANCTFIRPTTRRCLAIAIVASRISCTTGPGRLYGGIAQAGIARMDARFLDVLHDAGDDHRSRRR